jgi:hypothetical protein
MNSQRNQWSSWVTRWLQCTLKLSYIHLGIYIRSTSSLYSTSTPQIVAHWRHYLKSRLDLRVHLYFQIGIFSKSSDLWPIYCYQIDVLFKTKNCMCFYLVIWWMLVKSVRPHFWHENVSTLMGLSHHTVRTITDYYSIRIMYLPYNLFWRYSVCCSHVF